MFSNDCNNSLLGPLPRSDNPLQVAKPQWSCQRFYQKWGQIFVRSWNSHPETSRYQCTSTVCGTLFTNDCSTIGFLFLGLLPRFDNPLQVIKPQWSFVRHQWCLMSRVRPDFSCHCQAAEDPEIPALKQVDISAPARYEALYSPMIATICLCGSIAKVWKPFASCQATMIMSDINAVLSKVRPDSVLVGCWGLVNKIQ